MSESEILGRGPEFNANQLAHFQKRVTELTKQLALQCRAETCDKAELLQENVELRQEVERLLGELDECRRLLREALQACEVYLPVVPDDQARVALLTLEWYEAARAAGQGRRP